MVKVNGISMEQIANLTVTEFLQKNGYQKEYVAVERNGKIVPKKEYDKVILKDEDVLEVVSFVGGG
ncbi:sulfur carrier protein ThiS [Velocimicrobium porci]|uniref:Sulfur carrier protein ThiS n=1 Tax=Velocimicrobium porci TaxID=2606634 RepID=A0A6L5Y0S2_9FIRM|nr:sulfur carrier protein ThiS [Velocimicrobium porci]MSS64427.1 sulfur carrier protein ThiS [Velocimicrobium porci]